MIQKDEDVKSIHRTITCDTCGMTIKADSDTPINHLVEILRHICYMVISDTNDGFTVKCFSCQRKERIKKKKKKG